MKRYLVLLSGCAVFFAGCATVVDPKPGTITLEAAMQSVGRGLAMMKQAEIDASKDKDFKTGLMPSEAEVVFNISANKSDNGSLYVELTPVSTANVGGKAGASTGYSSSLSRGNQITIKFRNIFFTETTTTSKDGQTVTKEDITDPKTLSALFKTLKEYGGVVLYLK